MKKFSVDFVCPGDFENLAAEICYGHQIICRVSNERADGKLVLDFFYEARNPLVPLSVPFSEFIKLVDDVGLELIELRRKSREKDVGASSEVR